MLHRVTHHHHLRFIHTKKAHIIISVSLRQFAYGMMAVFIPIYLFTLGFSFTQIAIYHIIVFSLATLVMWPVMAYIRRYGVNHALAMSYIFTAFHVLGLYISQYTNTGLIIAGLFGALMGSVYWTAQWVSLTKIFDKKHMSENVGNLKILSFAAISTGPLVGGIIADTAGPSYALLTSFAVLVLAIFVIQKELKTEKQDLSEFKLQVPKKYVLRDSFSNVGMSFQAATGEFMWPLFIWLTIGNFSGLGIMFTSSAILAAIVMKIYSKKDDTSKHDLFKLAIYLRSAVFLFRPLAQAFGQFFVVEQAAGATDAMYSTAYGSRYVKHAKEAGAEKYIFYFETIGKLGVILMWVLFLLFISLFHESTAIRIIFIIAFPMTLLAHLLNRPIRSTS